MVIEATGDPAHAHNAGTRVEKVFVAIVQEQAVLAVLLIGDALGDESAQGSLFSDVVLAKSRLNVLVRGGKLEVRPFDSENRALLH